VDFIGKAQFSVRVEPWCGYRLINACRDFVTSNNEFSWIIAFDESHVKSGCSGKARKALDASYL